MNSGVSIVIPTLERTETLLGTLASVEAQTSTSWECLIVDDGSSENHFAAVRARIANDTRFKLVRRSSSNRGAPVCRNIGWREAKHELIIFLDSDDLLDPGCVELRLNCAKAFPDLDFWVFSTLTFDQSAGDRDVLLNVDTTEDPIFRFLKMDVMWLSTGPLWKRATLDRLGGWDETLLSWQDWDLSLRALLEGCQYRYFSDVDNYFRIQNPSRNSIGLRSFSPEHLLSHERLACKVCERIASNPARLQLASNLYFWIAYQWVQNDRLGNAMRVWKQAAAYRTRANYLMNMVLLLLLATPGLRSSMRKQLERRRHPAFAYWKGTFKRVRRVRAAGPF